MYKFKSLNFLTSLNWWRQTAALSWKFAPFCLFHLILLGLFCLPLSWLEHAKTMDVGSYSANYEQILPILLAALFFLIVFLLLAAWVASVLMYKGMIFALAYMLSNGSPTVETFKQAETNLSQKKTYIVKVWLFASIYLLLPIFILSIAGALKMLSSPQLEAFGFAPLALPDWLLFLNTAIICLLTLFITAYTMLTMILSAVSEETPAQAAAKPMIECFRSAATVLITAAVVFGFNVLISTPQVVLTLLPFASGLAQNTVLQAVELFWGVISTAFLLPLSLAPFCQLILNNSQA